jgi:hypothetical protein
MMNASWKQTVVAATAIAALGFLAGTAQADDAPAFVEVVILSDDEFDALELDEESLLLADPELIDDGGVPAAPLGGVAEDADDDGHDDLVLLFDYSELVEDGALDEFTEEVVLLRRVKEPGNPDNGVPELVECILITLEKAGGGRHVTRCVLKRVRPVK